MNINGFQDLEKIKDSLPIETQKVKVNKNKGKIWFNINLSDHAIERYCQRLLNGTKYRIEEFRDSLKGKIEKEGILGKPDRNRNQQYIALHKEGLFIKAGNILVTFVALDKLSYRHQLIYNALCEKRGLV